MKLLILGGTGFVSGMLAEQAVREGREVWTVTRGLRSRRTDVHALTADRHSVPELKAALAGLRFDAAVDCIRRDGYRRVTAKMYPNMRHEILNHAEHQVVYDDLLSLFADWLGEG